MSSSLQQGLPSNFNLDSTSPHEKSDVKKRQNRGKRKFFLNRYGSSKRQKLVTPSSRKKAPSNDPGALLDSERRARSNAVLNSGLNCDFQDSLCTSEHDGNKKNVDEDKQMKHEDLELCTKLGLDSRVMACSQAAQLDTAEELCSSPVMPSTNFDEPLSKSACDKMQSTPEKRALRPRRMSNNESKENLSPLANSPLMVGRRIEVYWPLDAAWYHGLISAYDNVRKKHKVSYDDGEEEWLCLAREKFKYEIVSMSESAQSCGKFKDSEVVRDGKYGLLSSSPKCDLYKNGTSNGVSMPVFVLNRKPTTSSTKITSPQVDATASKVLSPEASSEAKATRLKAQKDTKLCIQRQKGTSVALRRRKTDVDGSLKGEGSSVYESRQRHELKSACGKMIEATRRNKSSKGQHLQKVQKHRKKQKISYEIPHHKVNRGNSCSEGSQNIAKLDGNTFELGKVGANVQKVQPKLTNAKKRRLQSSNDEACIAKISNEGAGDMQESLNAGLAGPSPSEEVPKRTRRKYKVKSFVHTSLVVEGVEDIVGSVVPDHNRLACVKPSFLPQQDHRLSEGQKMDSVSCDKLPPESSRLDCNSDKLEPGSIQKLGRRKGKGGRRYTGRGSGHLRRIMNRHRMSRGSKPSHKHEKSLVATNKDNGLANCPCEQSLHQEEPTSLPLSVMEAASIDCKSMASPQIGNVSMKRSIPEGSFSHLNQRHVSKFVASLDCNDRPCPLKAFHYTIHFPRPGVVSSLFTWQLFNMLEAVGLSGGNGFEEKFQWKGSTRDLANIVLLFMSSVKSMPFTNQKHHKCWQGGVLHELWSVLSKKEQGARNLHAILSPPADDLLMEHVRQLISGLCMVNMTSRQMLNLFSSYVLKPYIVALLCEKGAQFRVVVQQYLLSSCPLGDGISFKRQFVRCVKLKSHAGAEADFVSCLKHFPVMQHECMAAHKKIEDWIASGVYVGFTQLPIPLPSFKLSGNKALQFLTASVVSKKTSCIVHDTLYVEQISDSFGPESWQLGNLSLPREAGDFLSHGGFSCFCDFRRQLDFYRGVCFDSMLQKWLDSPGGESFASGQFSRKLQIKVAKGALNIWDWVPESYLITKLTIDDTSFWEYTTSNGRDLPAEANQISLVERKTPVVVKEEYTLPGSATTINKEVTSDAFMGTSQIYTPNFLAYSASGSSSSSEDCLTKWKTTQMVDIAFRPHDKIEQKGVYGESHYAPHLQKRAGSKCRPHACKEGNLDMQHPDFSCTANILLSNESRSWREVGIGVELQSKKSEWIISVQLEAASYSHKVVESTITSRVNRYTHALMWKGGDGWSLEFGDRIQWIRFKRMHEECGHRNARAAFVKQIPIPFVKQLKESFEGRHSDSLLSEKWPGEVENALDCTKRVYDVDSEDEYWLARRSHKISLDAFERIIDKLERITYLRQGEMVASDEVMELCETMAAEDAVLSVHEYWSKKRARRENALIRYFESPLPKKYQKQLDTWKQKLEELECRFPDVSKEELQRRYPQPPLFAFCWPSRGLDVDNVSKRLQRQRSQKHLNALKYTRTSSFDTSEESQRFSLLRSQRVHDLDWYEATQKGDYWQRKMARDGFSEHLVKGFEIGTAPVVEAQANAAEARQSAQLYLLRFNSALQRAVAAVIDFEATYIAELALMSELPTASYGHLLDLRKRINRVMRQFSSLAGKEEYLEGDVELDGSSDDANEHEEEDLSWTVSIHEDGFGNSAFALNEEGTFLSIAERAHLEEWMRSTLRQRAC